MPAVALVCRKWSPRTRGTLAPFLHAARLDTLELYTEKELTVERDTVAGGSPPARDGR